MANTRFTTDPRSRVRGTQVGVRLNLHGFARLEECITPEVMVEILLEAGEPAKQEAVDNWAVMTGASRDSIELVPVEAGMSRSHHSGGVSSRVARVVLQAGGEKLINDPRNKSRKDYAPYLEFNGSPLWRAGIGGAPPGVLQRAVYGNWDTISATIRSKIRERIMEALV